MRTLQAAEDSTSAGGAGFQRSVRLYDIPEVTLVDMGGSRVSLASVLDDDMPVMLNFIFTSCPSICPVLSAMFSGAQKYLGPDPGKFRMVSISIDPEHDTPEHLRVYAKTFHAGPQWHFLTGDLDDIVVIEKAFDVFRGNKMNHEPYTFLRAAHGDSWVRIDGFIGAADLAEEYRRIATR